jgi:hypothetical protein
MINATLSKQMIVSTTADRGTSCAKSGIVQIEGSQIAWTKDGSITTMTILGGGDITFNETFIGPIRLLNSTNKVRN